MATPTTPNIERDHTTEAQSQPETSLNAALDGLDGAIAGMSTWDYTTDANMDVTTGANRVTVLASKIVKLTDVGVVLTAGRDFIVPDNTHEWIVWNTTARTIQFKNTSGTGVPVTVAVPIRHFFCDALDIKILI